MDKLIKKNYNLTIIILISIVIIFFIITSIVIRNKNNSLDIVTSNISEDEEITEDLARKMATQQFDILKEEINEEDLKVNKIEKDEEEYFFISSKNNNILIKIMGGKIVKINNVSVE